MLKVILISCLMLEAQGQWMNGNCRWRFGYLPVSIFDTVQCFWCYLYYPENVFPNGKPNFTLLDVVNKTVVDRRSGYVFFLDPGNKSSPMYEAFPSEKHAEKWADCCRASKECCDKMQKDRSTFSDGEKFCPRTWDGWQCWPDSKPGTIVTSACEDHVYFTAKKTVCSKPAEKTCTKDGKWLKVEGNEWTDYAPCGIRETHYKRIYFHLGCLGASVAFLIPAIIIFINYRRLRVHRIYIHTNLFASLVLSSITVILFKSLIILNQLKYYSENTALSRNEPWCKFLSVSIKYFHLTNYSWMFCEGFYLHKLIAAAFAEQKNLYIFYILGWGFPLVPVIIYSIVRVTMADKDCWTVPTNGYEWITNTPMLLALALNLIFLCDINRVLITKLRMKKNPQEPVHYRKAVRATLVLIPLFGLHSIMGIYRPSTGSCQLSEVYNYLNDGLDGLQGLIVAVIFCYTNNEVLSLLKRSYNRCRLRYYPRSFATSSGRTTVSSLSVMTRSSMVSETTLR